MQEVRGSNPLGTTKNIDKPRFFSFFCFSFHGSFYLLPKGRAKVPEELLNNIVNALSSSERECVLGYNVSVLRAPSII
jgi:hypothetical protein